MKLTMYEFVEDSFVLFTSRMYIVSVRLEYKNDNETPETVSRVVRLFLFHLLT